MTLKSLLAAIACLAIIGLCPTLQAKPMALEDVFDLEFASDPQPSADGKTIYFVRNYMDIQQDRVRSNLWQVDTRTGQMRPLTTGLTNDRSPRLSPDGTRLAYISNRDGSNQIYLLWLENGNTALISQLTDGASNLTWSPDSKQLYFTQFVKAQAKAPVSLPGKPEKAKWAKAPVFIDSTYYRADGAGFLPKGFEQIFAMDANGGHARQLTSAEMDHAGPLSLSPNGKTLYFSATPDPENDVINSEIYALELNSGQSKALTNRQGPDHHASISPNGKLLAYTGFDDKNRLYEVTRLYVQDLATGKVSLITDHLDRDIGTYYWHKNSKGLYLSFDDQGDSAIAWQPLKGKHKVLTRALGGTSLGRPYASGQFAVNGDVLAFTHSLPGRPAEIARMDTDGGKTQVLTSLNQDFNARVTLGKVEEVNFKASTDGRNIQGWIVYPPDFDAKQKYPLMLEIHGGPVANYGPRFSAEMQLFSAAGYVTLYINPRGSDSYGPEFVNLIHHNYPSQDYNDLMDGVDTLLAKGFIDEQRLFVTGGSGGGVLTAWIVGHTKRFAAAVVAKPVINWYSFTLTADAYPYFSRYWFAKKPWEDSAHYMQRSPIQYVGNVATPTMLLTGEADYRTPMSETEQFYQALKLQGVETAMVRIPDASHSITARPSNMMNKVAYILWWFAEHGGPSAAPENKGNATHDSP
ncbi:S9 family peptidase [Simiduia litorea]|uniref:S9 family peptidase n=1 Tax=Simiduia litorea TaxID=1435348 RepID=UPI0036F2FA4A